MKKLAVVLALLATASGCGPTSTGNPVIDIDVDSYSARNRFELIPSAYASVQSMRFCFKRLRFKMSGVPTDPDTAKDKDNIDLRLGEVDIVPSGNDSIVRVTVAPGTYTRVEFDLEDKCDSGTSLMVSNDNGVFSTDDKVTIKFEGTFVAVDGVQKLTLAINAIAQQLDQVTAHSQIKTRAEAASGAF